VKVKVNNAMALVCEAFSYAIRWLRPTLKASGYKTQPA
jgi:hypothetical protein